MNTRQKTPLGILLIAGFYTFGSLILLASLFIYPNEVSRQIATSQGLPVSIGVPILPLTATVGLLIAYGLFSLSPWGFFFTLVYLTYFGGVGLFLASKQSPQPYLGNVLWSLLVILYLLFKRKYFFR